MNLKQITLLVNYLNYLYVKALVLILNTLSSHLWEDTSGVYNACRSDVLSCDKNVVLYSGMVPEGDRGVDKVPTTCSRSLKFKYKYTALALSRN